LTPLDGILAFFPSLVGCAEIGQIGWLEKGGPNVRRTIELILKAGLNLKFGPGGWFGRYY
jgi:hypothetical protein